MLDPGSTVLSQYQNSPTLAQWIRNLNTYHDVGNSAQLGTLDGSEVLGTPGGAILTGRLSFIEQFIQGVWDLNTASGYGLDVLGRIVGVSRVLRIATTEYFGFSQMPESQRLPHAGSRQSPGQHLRWLDPRHQRGLVEFISRPGQLLRSGQRRHVNHLCLCVRPDPGGAGDHLSERGAAASDRL
jgi:hypothetical protein